VLYTFVGNNVAHAIIADDGGVFKAKNQNRDTRGAKEVRDTGDTKVDLPIDQVRAEEVKVSQD
jgi:hypothetical protein